MSFQGALALSNLRRGPFIALSGTEFHEVALGDPLHDADASDDSDSDSDAGPSTSTRNKRKKKSAPQKKRRKNEDEGGGNVDGDDESKKPKAAEQEEAIEEEEKERWVQCDRCSRWRVVPDDSWPTVEQDPRPFWFCEFARWDVRTTVPFEGPCQQR